MVSIEVAVGLGLRLIVDKWREEWDVYFEYLKPAFWVLVFFPMACLVRSIQLIDGIKLILSSHIGLQRMVRYAYGNPSQALWRQVAQVSQLNCKIDKCFVQA